MIINIDNSINQGTHWICLFIKNKMGYYFNSYGFPITQKLQKYCTKPPECNSGDSIRKDNEAICGHYCINVLYKLSNGYVFKDILDEM